MMFLQNRKEERMVRSMERRKSEETTILCRPVRSSYRLPFLWVNWEDMGGTKLKLCFNKIPMDIVYRTESCSLYMGYTGQ